MGESKTSTMAEVTSNEDARTTPKFVANVDFSAADLTRVKIYPSETTGVDGNGNKIGDWNGLKSEKTEQV